MVMIILIGVGVLIGLRVERWRGVFIGAASVGVVWAVLATGSILLMDADEREYGLVPAPFSGLMLFVLTLIVAAITYAIRKSNRRPEATMPELSFEADQNRDS